VYEFYSETVLIQFFSFRFRHRGREKSDGRRRNAS